MTASPMYFSTEPPWRRIACEASSKCRASTFEGLRVEAVGKARRIGEVGEEHGDDLANLANWLGTGNRRLRDAPRRHRQ